MVHFMMGYFKMERKTVKAFLNGQTIQSMMGIGKIIVLRDLVNIDGRTTVFTLDNGETINYMEKASTLGQTEEDMRDNMMTIENMATENTVGQMGKSMKANGTMENSMERPSLPILKARAKWVCGRMVNELNGLKIVDYTPNYNY